MNRLHYLIKKNFSGVLPIMRISVTDRKKKNFHLNVPMTRIRFAYLFNLSYEQTNSNRR